MFISKFSVENWDGNQNKISVQAAKDWQQIQTAIDQLDGHRHTLVTLETEGEAHMAIGGGSTKYLIYLTFDNERFYYVAQSSNLDTNESLIVGGQEGIYPSRFCVEKNTVMKAAKTFVEIGIMENSISWEQDSVVEQQEFAKV